MWPFKNKYELYSGKIRIGSSKVPFKILFDENSFRMIEHKIELKGWDIGFFKKWFNKLIFPLIKYGIETDELFAKASLKVKKLHIIIYPTIPKTGIKLLDESERMSIYESGVGGYRLSYLIGLKLDRIMDMMQEYFDKGKFKSQQFLKILRHEITHYYQNLQEDIKKKEEQTEVKITKDMDFVSYWPYRKFIESCHSEGLSSFRQYMRSEKFKIRPEEQWHKNPYSLGRYMCTIIALIILKKENRLNEVKLILDLRTKTMAYPVDKIAQLLKRKLSFYITKIPEDIQLKTSRIIARLDFLRFLKIYDDSCVKLGIERKEKGLPTIASYNALKQETLAKKAA